MHTMIDGEMNRWHEEVRKREINALVWVTHPPTPTHPILI